MLGPLGLSVHARPFCVQSTQACWADILRRLSEKLLAWQKGWGEPTVKPRTYRGPSAWHWALPGSFLNGGLLQTREGPARSGCLFARQVDIQRLQPRRQRALPSSGAQPAPRFPPHPTLPPSPPPGPLPSFAHSSFCAPGGNSGIRRRRHLSFMKESAP